MSMGLKLAYSLLIFALDIEPLVMSTHNILQTLSHNDVSSMYIITHLFHMTKLVTRSLLASIMNLNSDLNNLILLLLLKCG